MDKTRQIKGNLVRGVEANVKKKVSITVPSSTVAVMGTAVISEAVNDAKRYNIHRQATGFARKNPKHGTEKSIV